MHDSQAGIAEAEGFQEFARAVRRAIINEIEIGTQREGSTPLDQRQNVFALVIGGNDDDGSHRMTPFVISGSSSGRLATWQTHALKHVQPLQDRLSCR
jgi:hypothetical protein